MSSIRARVAALAGVVALSAAVVTAVAAPAQAAPLGKISYCHATGSAKNPYNYITTSVNAVQAWSYTNGKHMYDLIDGYGPGILNPKSNGVTPEECDAANTEASLVIGSGVSDPMAIAQAAAAAANALANPSAAVAAPAAAAATPSTAAATPAAVAATPSTVAAPAAAAATPSSTVATPSAPAVAFTVAIIVFGSPTTSTSTAYIAF